MCSWLDISIMSIPPFRYSAIPLFRHSAFSPGPSGRTKSRNAYLNISIHLNKQFKLAYHNYAQSICICNLTNQLEILYIVRGGGNTARLGGRELTLLCGFNQYTVTE